MHGFKRALYQSLQLLPSFSLLDSAALFVSCPEGIQELDSQDANMRLGIFMSPWVQGCPQAPRCMAVGHGP